MKTSSLKAKGRNLQKWIVKKVLETFPDLSPKDVLSRSMGAPGTDVILSKKANDQFPFDVEAKARASIAVYEWLEQCNARALDTPLVIAKGNHKEPIAILYAEDFFKLLKQ